VTVFYFWQKFGMNISPRYHALLSLTVALAQTHAFGKYHWQRPTVPVHGSASRWWAFALRCVRSDVRASKGRVRHVNDIVVGSEQPLALFFIAACIRMF
jgi:hypothetical protein